MTEQPARRRRAPRAERTTDVTRFRGVLAAAITGAIAVVVAMLALAGGDARRGAPGPVTAPHVAAGVSCAACHDAPTFTAACNACHPPREPRVPHRELVARGTLGCVDCHPGHGGGGVRLAADGTAIRYGTGDDEPAGTTRFRPARVVTVPIVETSACTRCHDVDSPRDRIAACLIANHGALGDRPTVCFDEHVPVRDATGAIAARAAAWDAAREVAARSPRAPAAPRDPGGPWPWLGIGLVAAVLAFGGARVLGKARRPPPAPAPATPAPVRRLPVIDTSTCLGCYACVDACPYDVLEIHRYVAVVARPADCCGLILCEQKCPNGSLAISITEAAPARVSVDDSLESRTVPGLFLAGDVGGQPLIRTALDQGARAVRAIADRPRASGLDVVIVGAGPAGLAAALEAELRGLRYVALEQATIADSIRSFPRGKLVIDPDLPNTSQLWLAEATKEELLARWTRTVRERKPSILEGRRVTAIAKTASGFTVDEIDRDGRPTTHTAAHVIVAIGRRGSPRKLAVEIPESWAADVHYSLADARSFAGRRVLVVGLGDVAMEAAIALSRQPGTEVAVAARAADFRRGKARNIAEVRRRATAGTLRVIWQAEVVELAHGRAALRTPAGLVEVTCDSVIVMIGSIPAEDLLHGIGVLQKTDTQSDP